MSLLWHLLGPVFLIVDINQTVECYVISSNVGIADLNVIRIRYHKGITQVIAVLILTVIGVLVTYKIDPVTGL